MQRGLELLTIRFAQRRLLRFVDYAVQFFDVDIDSAGVKRSSS